MSNISKELIQNTIEVWLPKAGYTLSEDEAIEIIQNISNFFDLLIEIDRKQKDIDSMGDTECRKK